MLKRYFTVGELAKATGYSRGQIHNQIKGGNIIPAYTSEKIVLIGRAEFDRIVFECTRNLGRYRTFPRISKKKNKLRSK